MPGTTPPTSQLEWLSSTTAMIVLFWSRATRDLLKSFGWGIRALHRLDAARELPCPRRPPHRIFQFRAEIGFRDGTLRGLTKAESTSRFVPGVLRLECRPHRRHLDQAGDDPRPASFAS